MFRCSLILAHRKWLGQINTTDMVTRFFWGLIDTNLVPASFMAHPDSKYNHFDGSPVDFVAEVGGWVTALARDNSLTGDSFTDQTEWQRVARASTVSRGSSFRLCGLS